MYSKSSFSGRLYRLIWLNNKSNKEVCESVGISTQSLNNYLTGRRLPHIDVIINLAKYFNTSTDYLLLGTEAVNTVDVTGLSSSQLSILYDLIHEFRNDNLIYEIHESPKLNIISNQENE